jgi:signal transduction histidine kinase/DNA-binding response OmpR family regulator
MSSPDKPLEDQVSILIVDDLPSQHVVLRTVLEAPGHDVIAVSSGREALKAVLEQDFAVILLDVNMPHMDGFETASMLRSYRRTASTPIIFVTAYVDDAEMARGYSLGAVDYISSPVVPEILRAKVGVFVQMHRMNRELLARAAQREEVARAEARRAAADQARQRADFLAHVSHALTRSLDVETTVGRILDTAVPALADVACVLLAADGESDSRSAIRFASAALASAGAPGAASVAPLDRFFELSDQALEAAERVVCRDDTAGIFAPLMPSGEAAAKSLIFDEVTFHPLLTGTQRKALVAFGVIGHDDNRQPAPVVTEFVSRASIALENAILYSALRDEDRRKNQFLAMLAHELRNPLAPIANAVSVMKAAPPGDAAVSAWAGEIIGTQIEHMVRIVDDLLDVSRIARNTVSLRREPALLRTVVERAVETSRPHFAARSQVFQCDPGACEVMIEGDVVRLTQIVANLLNNASKFSPPGGHISLAADFADGTAVITVTDDGEGIDAQLIPHVFDLFAQGDSSLDRAQGGLGIGLTLARHLAELHGGSIQCWSAGRGRGARFMVKLPARVASERAVHVADVFPLHRKSALRVLVVDDSTASAESLKLFLEMQGYDVRCAFDGAAALALAHSFVPQVTLLDIGLPGMNGYEVAKAMRKDPVLTHCLLVALSGYGQDEDRRRSAAAGIDHHLIKPANLNSLVDLIGRHAMQNDTNSAMDGRQGA